MSRPTAGYFVKHSFFVVPMIGVTTSFGSGCRASSQDQHNYGVQAATATFREPLSMCPLIKDETTLAFSLLTAFQ